MKCLVDRYLLGQLYLSHFSGPVEGILMIVAIFIITGCFGMRFAPGSLQTRFLLTELGPLFWEQRLWTFLRLDNLPIISKLPNFSLNQSFMVFGGFCLAMNVWNSYYNVRVAMRKQDKHHLHPLFHLLPFVLTVVLQVAWLSHPRYNNSWIIDSAAFVPFLCAWGLQFAHQVGRMILAHVTKGDLPMWDWVWIWSVLGALDANLPLFGM